jgi:hypothetical protein
MIAAHSAVSRRLNDMQCPKDPVLVADLFDTITASSSRYSRCSALPEAAGFDAIWKVTVRLTKAVHFIPFKKSTGPEELAAMFIQHIHRLHGMPRTIVSDRDIRFTAPFWRSFMQALGTAVHMSTAFHPQSDGQSERTNRTIETMLRAFVSSRRTIGPSICRWWSLPTTTVCTQALEPRRST